MDLTDTTQWPDAALSELIRQVHAEQERRSTLLVTADVVRAQQAAYLDARDRSGQYATGSSPAIPTWVQPTGAHDVYPLDYTVMHGGKTWASLRADNPDEPGVASWREQTASGTAPAWVQPTGSQDAYHLGDIVTYQGRTWQVTLTDSGGANVWSPNIYGWTEVTA